MNSQHDSRHQGGRERTRESTRIAWHLKIRIMLGHDSHGEIPRPVVGEEFHHAVLRLAFGAGLFRHEKNPRNTF